MVLNICTKFHENIPDGIKVIELTRFSLEIFQRDMITQKCWWSYSSSSLHIA